jgi:hypothetical protein
MTAKRLLVLVLLAAGLSLFGQEVEAWFARAPEAAAYASLREELLRLAEKARVGLLGDGILADRLLEGAKKGVPPARLAAALGDEVDRLLAVAGLWRARGLMPPERGEAARLFSQVDIDLRAGFVLEDFASALDGAIARRGRTGAASTRALATISAIGGIELDAAERQRLLAAMAAGSLPDEKLASLGRSLGPQQGRGQAGTGSGSKSPAGGRQEGKSGGKR